MYLAAVALCVAMSCLLDISGAQSCVDRDGTVDKRCGDCTVKGDPEITTYDPHSLTNVVNPIPLYTAPGGPGFDAKYAISQQGFGYDPLFGVSAHFKQGGPEWNKTVSFVSTVTYTEPGLNVELILPEKLDTKLTSYPDTTVFYCQKKYPQGFGAPPPANDTLCATKIKVNGVTRDIPDDGSVSAFRGTEGTVLVFKVGDCDSYKCQIIVVGSMGITVSLLVDPGLWTDEGNHDFIYYLNVYSLPSLRHKLFGLCGKYTGELTNTYTPRVGRDITDFNNLDNGFIKTWKIGCSCAFGVDKLLRSGCVITESAPAKQACQCSPGGAIGFPEFCNGTVVDCKNPSLSACTDPNTGYGSCLQGEGNCGGYDPLPIPTTTNPTTTKPTTTTPTTNKPTTTTLTG